MRPGMGENHVACGNVVHAQSVTSESHAAGGMAGMATVISTSTCCVIQAKAWHQSSGLLQHRQAEAGCMLLVHACGL